MTLSCTGPIIACVQGKECRGGGGRRLGKVLSNEEGGEFFNAFASGSYVPLYGKPAAMFSQTVAIS